jgi:hypothetical protein
MDILCFVRNFKIFSSETTSPNGLQIGTNNAYEIFYKSSSFCLDPAKQMATMSNSCKFQQSKDPLGKVR